MRRAVEDDLRDPALARLLGHARDKFEAQGGVSGAVTLGALDPREAEAIDAIWRRSARRRPRRGQSFRAALRDLDASLRETFGLALEQALQITGGPLRLRPQERTERREQAEQFWNAALAHPLCACEPSVHEWVTRARRSGRLGARPWENGRGQALHAILDIGADLPRHPPIERSALATEALGDPHALDEAPLGSLLESQLAAREGLDQASLTAADRRALLARFGVLCDPASATVLTLGLQPVGSSPLEQALRLLHGSHVVLTLGQLQSSQPRFAAGMTVRLCENPAVVLRAESRLGAASGPLVCTGGWPGSAVCTLLDAFAGDGARFVHHGDFDWDGLAIARWLRERYAAGSWRYDAAAYRAAVEASSIQLPRLPAPRNGVGRRDPLEAELIACGVAVSEEATLDDLLDDLEGVRP